MPEGASVVAPDASGSALLAGCVDEGVFVSIDGGERWAPLNDGPEGKKILSLAGSATFL